MKIRSQIFSFSNPYQELKLLLELVVILSIRICHRFCDRIYDLAYNVKTSKQAELSTLDIESPNRIYGKKYQGTPYRVLKKLFRRVNRDFSSSTMLDFGAGKGRTLIMGAKFGFKRLIGVDFSSELCIDARKNLSNSKLGGPKFEIVHADATRFPVPPEADVFYFYNPFTRQVLNHVLDNIEKTSDNNSEKLFVYTNPLLADVFENRKYRLIDKIDCINHNYIVHFYRPPL
jgi:SAM-dependent methyltransferase